MNSSSLSRHNNSTHVPKQLPLQPLSKNSQDSTPSTRTYRDKNSSKSSKLSEPQSFSSKHKTLRHRNSKENMPDSRMTSISVISKIPDEKEDPFFVPPHKVKNSKKDHHTEKSFQDLNKSLANLALGRCIGRSSSDNDAIGHLNRTESDFQRSYGPSNTCMDANQTYHSSSKTPLSSKRSVRNMQTSAQKGMEVTPFSFVNQITRESVKAQEGQFKRETSSKDLMLSNLEYARVQNSACGKSARLNHNMHYLPIDTKVRRNLVTEGNYQMEFSNIENLDNTDTQMFSYYYSNDVQLSYLNGEINIEHEGDDEELESVTERKVKQEGSISNEPLQKNVPHFGSQQNYRSTPSFKRTKCYNSNTSSKNNNGNPRRYSDLASVPRTTVKNMGMSMRNLRERSGRYELNHISDDVEYMMGGVGINQELRKKQKPNSRNKSSFVETEASSKRERAESVRGETLVVWKQDLMKIKKEMESRKKSYAEVNKFVKMHGNGTSVARVKDSRESSFDPYATRKTSNISLANLSVLEKMDTLKPYSSGLKGLVTQEISEDRRRLSGLKTVGDYSDKRSATTPLEEQINAMSKYRVKTGPYYDFNNETNDFNHSFRYEENIIFEKTQRQPCCGPEKMCNIF